MLPSMFVGDCELATVGRLGRKASRRMTGRGTSSFIHDTVRPGHTETLDVKRALRDGSRPDPSQAVPAADVKCIGADVGRIARVAPWLGLTPNSSRAGASIDTIGSEHTRRILGTYASERYLSSGLAESVT